jgi:hypothetical protein
MRTMRALALIATLLACAVVVAAAEPWIKKATHAGYLEEKHGRVVEAATGLGVPQASVVRNWRVNGFCLGQTIAQTDANGDYVLASGFHDVSFDRTWIPKAIATVLGGIVPIEAPMREYQTQIMAIKPPYILLGDEDASGVPITVPWEGFAEDDALGELRELPPFRMRVDPKLWPTAMRTLADTYLALRCKGPRDLHATPIQQRPIVVDKTSTQSKPSSQGQAQLWCDGEKVSSVDECFDKYESVEARSVRQSIQIFTASLPCSLPASSQLSKEDNTALRIVLGDRLDRAMMNAGITKDWYMSSTTSAEVCTALQGSQ